jgi:hypothetical protein
MGRLEALGSIRFVFDCSSIIFVQSSLAQNSCFSFRFWGIVTPPPRMRLKVCLKVCLKVVFDLQTLIFAGVVTHLQ